MMRLPHSRRFILGAALLAAIVASLWPEAPQNQLAAIVEPALPQGAAPAHEKNRVAEPELPRIDSLRPRPPQRGGAANLFAAENWNPPPPPPPRPAKAPPPPPAPQPVAEAAPPPPPSAPPFPYTVAGSVADTKGKMVVFSKQNENFVLRTGEMLEQSYRLDTIEAESVTLTYLPLGLAQRVPLPGAP
jgi:hypothetical protein